jgi:hypothetical protein
MQLFDMSLYYNDYFINAAIYGFDLTNVKMPPDLSGATFGYNVITDGTTDFSAVTSLRNTRFDGFPIPSNVNFNNVTDAEGLQFSGSSYTGLIGDTYFVTINNNGQEQAVPTPLNSSGTGWWASGGYYYQQGAYYINGKESTLPESGTGWDSSSSGNSYQSNSDTYYIGGVATTLNESGTGGWNGSEGFLYYINGVLMPFLNGNGSGPDYTNNTYYINGELTYLDSNGFGYWNGAWYVNGQVPDSTFTGCVYDNMGNPIGYFQNGNYLGSNVNCDGTGLDNQYYYAYVINGQPTSLSSGGNGYLNGVDGDLYIGGQANPTYTGAAWDAYGSFEAYYINGQLTQLDESGNGTFNDLYYRSGAIFSGYDENRGVYYISGVATELDSTGSGTYNGQTYVNGVVQGGGGGGGNGGGGPTGALTKIEGNAKFFGKVKFVG